MWFLLQKCQLNDNDIVKYRSYCTKNMVGIFGVGTAQHTAHQCSLKEAVIFKYTINVEHIYIYIATYSLLLKEKKNK